MASKKRSKPGQPPLAGHTQSPSIEAVGQLPRWPVILAAVVYGGWIAFLLVMAYLRVRETARL